MTRELAAVLIGGVALCLGGCSHEREFRVAYIGAESAPPSAGDEAVATAPPMVASGNSFLGPTAQLARSGVAGGVVNGSVSGVLAGTSQTLVQLTNGASLLLNQTGAAVGDLVSIDLGAGRVISGPSALLGAPVSGGSFGGALLAPVAGLTGAPASAGALLPSATGAGTRAVTDVVSPVRSTTGSLSNIVNGALGRGCC